MALLYIDGAESYTALAERWPLASQNFNISSGAARHGANGFNGGSTNVSMGRALPTAIAECFMGFALRITGSLGTNTMVTEYLDSAQARQICLKVNYLGGVFVSLNGSDTPLVSSANGVVARDVWAYIEWRVLIANSGGRAVVRVNGATVIDFTGDTQQTANANVAVMTFGGNGISSSNTFHVDDIYALDTTGADNNTFLGDVRVQALKPTGTGNSTQFTPSTGSNWQNVDDAASDGDTTYNSSSTAGQKDTFVTEDMSTNATVYGVQLVERWRKDDAGARTARSIIRTGATDYESANVVMSDTYVTELRMFDDNPNTAANWTPSEVNGVEIGYKIEA